MAQYFGGTRQLHDPARRVYLAVAVIGICMLFSSSMILLSSAPVSTPTAQLSTPGAVSMVELLVPMQDIEPNTNLAHTQFRIEQRPAEVVPENALSSFEQIRSLYAKTLLVRGQAVVPGMVAERSPHAHIGDDIPDGYRAVSIFVNEVSSVAGWVWPGSRVDVVWIKRLHGEKVLKPLVQNAKVLSAERTLERDVSPGMPVPTTVTLLVTVDDANKIRLAEDTGKLMLNLRNRTEVKVPGPQGPLTEGNLMGGGRTPVQQEEPSVGTLVVGGQKFNVKPGGVLEKKRRVETEESKSR